MAYGYPGDATSDTNSSLGVGDQDNRLSDDPDHTSAALTLEGRQERFGVTGKSTGLPFVDPKTGQTVYDDDTAPTDFTYNGEHRHNDPSLVDVYDPTHPPDPVSGSGSLTTSKARLLNPGLSAEYPDEQSTDTPPPEEDEQIPQEPKESPLAKVRNRYPNLKATDNDLIKGIHDRIAPFMDFGKFNALVTHEHGEQAIKNEVEKGLTPLEKLKQQYPNLNKIADDAIIKGAYERLVSQGKINDSVISLDDFRDQMQPQDGVVNSAYQFWKGMSRESSASTHAASEQAYSQPQNAIDFAKAIYQLMDRAPGNLGSGIQTLAEAADKWLDDHTGIEDYWKDFVGWMNDHAGKELQQAQLDQERANQAKGNSGTAGKTIGGYVTGSAIGFATLYMPGAPLKTALVLASGYEGLSHVGAAVQAHHDYALLEGIQGAGMGALTRYMMNSPNGKALMGFNMFWANTAEDTVQKLLSGQPIDWYEQATKGTIDITAGLMMGKSPEAPRAGLAPELSSRTPLDPLRGTDVEDAAEPYKGNVIQVNKGKVSVNPYSIRKSFSFSYDAALEEVDKAVAARIAGDTGKAVKHMDKALASMKPAVRKEFAKNVIKATAEAVKTKEVQTPDGKVVPNKKVDQASKILYSHFYGLSPKRPGQAGFTLNWGKEIGDWFKDHAPDKESWVRNIAPQTASPEAEKMWAVSGYRTSEAKQAFTAMPKEVARALEIDKVLRGGEKVARRFSVFDKMNDGQLKEILASTEEGDVHTGNKAADFLMNDYYRTMNKAMQQVEHDAGFEYPAKDFYFYHLVDNNQKPQFERWYNDYMTNDPRWTQKRQFPTYRDMFRAGFKPKVLNPETIMQIRLFSHTQAIRKVMTLRDAVEAGAAFSKDAMSDKEKKQMVAEGYADIRSPNGEGYFVDPKAAQVIHNAWEPSKIYDAFIVGPIMKGLAFSKGGLSRLKLAWSITHPKHIVKMSLAHNMAQMSRSVLSGDLRGATWRKHLTNVMRLGITNIQEIKAWRGDKLNRPLTIEEKQNLQDAKAMGLDFSMSEERQMEFAQRLGEWLPQWTKGAKAADRVVSEGYKFLTAEGAQKFMFGTLIPMQKFNAMISLRDSILKENPNLRDDPIRFKAEMMKAGQQIEARFGEMFYDNLYWNKVAKDVGQSTLLSLGWQIGFVRIYAGAAHDMTDNVAHAGELMKKLRGQKSDHTFLTDRILFAGTYTALNMLEAAIVTYVATKTVPQGLDYIFPRVGKGSDGKDKRVQPVEFSREWASWYHHIQSEGILGGSSQFWWNKTQPILQTAVQDWQNKNYYGQEIADPLDPWWEQFQDHAKFWLVNAGLPIPFEMWAQNTGQQPTIGDTLLSMSGYPKAPGWTTRTTGENLIVETYGRMYHDAKTKETVEKSKAYDLLRQSVLDKDQRGTQTAAERLRKLGVSAQSIKKSVEKPEQGPEDYMFKKIGEKYPQEQLKLFNKLSPEEQEKYKKSLRKKQEVEQ